MRAVKQERRRIADDLDSRFGIAQLKFKAKKQHIDDKFNFINLNKYTLTYHFGHFVLKYLQKAE